MAWSTPPTFVSSAILTAAQLNILSGNFSVIGGVRSTWTPTWTNLTLGNGTVTARYRQVDKEVDFFLQVTVGSTTAFTTSTAMFSLPVAAAFSATPFLGSALDVSASTTIGYPIAGELAGSTTTVSLRCWSAIAAGNAFQIIRDVNPFTWAVGDILTISGRYEAA